jgi:RNA polymerase-binding transcription factor DksA
MNEIVLGHHLDKLIRRRGQIVMTLRHLVNEQKQVEQNTDWLDQAAYESRVNLLDRLSDWYATEIGQIDKAIERIENNRYGFCVACHQAIEGRAWKPRQRRSSVASAKSYVRVALPLN